MPTVTSRDGTTIAYSATGTGPALIFVDGALCYRGFGPSPALAKALSARFTVYTYDRRGRGESGDTAPFDIKRELEDLDALIEVAGGSAFAVGASSGAALVLEAAHRGAKLTRIAGYEPPFIVDGTRSPVRRDILAYTQQLAREGKRGEIIVDFMKIVQVPWFGILMMRLMPVWKQLKAVAHTIPYDYALVTPHQMGEPIPRKRWSGVNVPAILIDGGKSPQWMRNGVTAAAREVPNAQYKTLPGQTHMVKADVLAPALIEWFGAHRS